jgi:O-antigen/teichoic acid export membrane protein
MSRVRQSTWNFGATLAFAAITLVVGLFATHYLVIWLGDERLGAFQTLTDCVGYLALFEMGVGGALMPMIAQAINRGDPAEMAGTMATGFAGYRRIVVLNLLGGVVLYFIIPHLLHTGPAMTRDVHAATIISVAASLLLPITALRPLWEADQRGYAISLILIVSSLFTTAASLIFARLHWGVAGQALAATLGLCVSHFLLLVQTLRKHPDIVRWFFSPPTDQHLAQMRHLNWPTFVLGVAGRLSIFTDRIIIAFFLGPITVVPFFITQKLNQTVQIQLVSVGGSVWAGMVQLLQTHGKAAFNQRVYEISQLIMVLGLSALVPILAYNGAFIAIWMNGRPLYAGIALTTFASVNSLLLAVFSFWGWMFSGTGRIRSVLPLNLVSTALNVVASVASTALFKTYLPGWAILGPVLGTSIAYFAVNIWWYPLLLRRFFDTSISDLFIACARPLVCFIPFVVVASWVARAYPPRHWVMLLPEMGLSSVVHLAFCWFFALTSAQRTVWMERVGRIVPLQRFLKAASHPRPASFSADVPTIPQPGTADEHVRS